MRLKNIILEFLMLPLIKSFLLVVGPMIVLVGFSATTAAQDKTVLQQERNLTMKILARSMNQIKNATDFADKENPVTAIVLATNKLFNMWPKGSGGGKTRAKNEIWSNMADFKNKLTDMGDAADRLLTVVKQTDATKFKTRFIAVGRTCGACHKIYRGPKS